MRKTAIRYKILYIFYQSIPMYWDSNDYFSFGVILKIILLPWFLQLFKWLSIRIYLLWGIFSFIAELKWKIRQRSQTELEFKIWLRYGENWKAEQRKKNEKKKTKSRQNSYILRILLLFFSSNHWSAHKNYIHKHENICDYLCSALLFFYKLFVIIAFKVPFFSVLSLGIGLYKCIGFQPKLFSID